MLDSVYSHGKYKATVMEATVPDKVRERNYDPYAETKDWLKKGLQPLDGSCYLLSREKQTALDEVTVCQIATQLLEATSYLYDMRLCHTDISHVNYLLDDAFNVSPSPQTQFYNQPSYTLKEPTY